MLRVAVIGVGSMGRNHARVFAELDSAELVGVVDQDLERAKEVGDRLGVPAFADCVQMLTHLRPDAVSIVVPTFSHYEIATQALIHNAHVLIEKPMVASIEEGERLIRLAADVNRQIMVGQIVRFNTAYQMVKEFIKSGELGKVLQVACRRMGPYPARIRDVGVVLDLATHDVDLMRFLIGQDPVGYNAQLGWNLHESHEDLLLGLLSFPSGAKGIIETNWLTPKPIREVVVLGERGVFLIDEAEQKIEFQANGLYADNGNVTEFTGVSKGIEIHYEVEYQEPLRAELEAFVDAVTNNKPVPVTGEDGLATMRSVFALLSAGMENEMKTALIKQSVPS